MKRIHTLMTIALMLSVAQTSIAQPWSKRDTITLTEQQSSRPGQYFHRDELELEQSLLRATQAPRGAARPIIELPMPSGQTGRFTVEASSIMADGLQAKFPGMRTYRIRGIDNPRAGGRMTLTPRGINAMIRHPGGVWFIDQAGDDLFRAYRKSATDKTLFNCGVEGHNHSQPVAGLASRHLGRVAGSVRVYRLAVAAAAEYVDAIDDGDDSNGDAVSDVIGEMVITINRVNEIYQRDLGIKLELVADNDELVFDTDASEDPYSNPNVLAMLDQNQAEIDTTIGSANYDIGHVFGTGGGGIATVGSACSSISKAQGATGLAGGPGDAFYIDYVAHEIGHQFGADHTFNGTSGSCEGSARAALNAVEPGSGSTVMAYAGICSGEDLQFNSDALFHAFSIQEINGFTSGSGAACGELQNVTNNSNQPTVDAGSDYTIPANTPFVLSAAGADADGDTLSYTWDQMDPGTETSAATHGTDLGDNALFRAYPPRAEEMRYFPNLGRLLEGHYSATNLTEKGETLPATNRTLDFTVTVRDGKNGIGQDQVAVSSVVTGDDFRVTSHGGPATISDPTATQTVEWDVADTTTAPISCSQVDIKLLKFNTTTLTHCVDTLAEAVANTGSYGITNMPDENIAVARFMVQCSNNIFFALSEGDLEVQGATDAEVGCFSVSPQAEAHATTVVELEGTVTDSGGNVGDSSGGEGDSGALSRYSLLLLALFAVMRRHAVRRSQPS